MPTARPASLTLSLLALCALAGPTACAQTITLIGPYDGNQAVGGNGFDTAPGQSYAAVSGATSDNNRNIGLFASGSTVTVTGGEYHSNAFADLGAAFGSVVTVTGGTFTGNGFDGLLASAGARVSVSGGAFSGNNTGLYDENSPLTVSSGDFSSNMVGLFADYVGFGPSFTTTVTGGNFTNNAVYGLYALGSTVTVTGGNFSGNVTDLRADSDSSITLYGTGLAFAGFPLGGVTYVGPNIATVTNIGRGTITGTLQKNAVPSIITFSASGTVTLVNTPAVPEPSSAILAAPALALLGLTLRARKRSA